MTAAEPTLTLHHLGISQSERIAWLCEELALPYRLIRYDRAKSGMAPPEYKALYPAGTAPVITDGDLTLGESGAIAQYLLALHDDGTLAPRAGDADFAEFLYWFHFANASLISSELGMMMIDRMSLPEQPLIAWRRERTEGVFALVEQRLSQAPYLAGERFTAADIMAVFPLTTMRTFTRRDLTPNPAIRAYLQRIGARPAYARAMASAEPDMSPMLA